MSRRPLDGLRIVVTRAKAQASVLNERLAELGAVPVEVATIEIVAPADGGSALRAALRHVGDYERVVVASPNGARTLVDATRELGADPPAELPPVACVGPSTAARFEGSPWVVDVVPDRNVAEGLVERIGAPTRAGSRLLLVQAEVSRDVLETGLGESGWNVERVVAYRTVDASVTNADRELAAGADIVTFTSSSTVDRFLRLVGRDALPSVVASIGPITSRTVLDHGLQVDIEADPHTIDGLVDALVAWAAAP